MAITTVTYDVLTDSGITYESIGLSDTLDNYTLEEILDYTYCGEYDVLKRNVMINSPDTALEAPSLLDNLNIPITYTSSNPLHWEAGQGDYTNPDGLFGRILWLKTEGTYADVITEDNAEDYKLITSWTATKYYFTIPTLKQGWITASRAATSWNDNKTYPCLYWTGNDKGSLKFHSKYGQAGDVEFSLSYQPYIIAEAREGSYILYNLNQGENIHTWYGARNVNIYGSPDNFADGNLISFDKAATYSIVYAAREWFGDAGTDKDLRDYPAGNELPFNWNMGRFNELQLSQTVVGDQYLMFCSSGGSQYNAYAGIRYWTYPSVKHDSLLFWANAGVFFIADSTVYKPIISNNIVTGYSDDLSTESDYDNYDGKTKHDSSPTPPGPDGDDESDDQASGGIYSGAQGMCNLYYMTAGEIKDLQNWFRGSVFSPGIQIPADFDPSNQLIGLMAFPIELGGSVDSTTITFRTADNQSVDTGVSCQKAYGDDLKFDLGTIDIPARMEQRGVPFLDYSCQVEVYIPFCDVVQLDVQQVIGTTLTCEMWISPATGDVSAMLSSGTHPVAYTSGNCAQQLPISVSSYGAIAGAKLAAQNRNTQAVFQAAQNVVKDITNTGAIGSAISNHTAVNGQGLVEFSRIPQVQNNTGLAVGAGIKAAGTIVNTALQLTAQNFDNRYALQVAKNSAPTHVSGSFGSCTSWHFPNYCYVKITRPHFQKPDNYGHTEAVPVVATKPLSSLSGLTTCVNPDVSSIGTATMQELETIKSYLMSGVIL